MHDAKMDFNYQLFKKEHKSYYNQQDLDILNECRTTANVGRLKDPPNKMRAGLVEIDMTKAFTGAYMKINAIPCFNEFDTWEPYTGNQPLKDLSMYLVETKEFDLYFNKRYNQCYGYFLKQIIAQTVELSTGINASKKENNLLIHAVKHPSVIKKVNYKQMVLELWKTTISDDPQEDAALKKIIANTNFGMLEKQFNKNVKSTLFDTYEDAKWFQVKYGGTITLIKQYEEKETWKYESPLDKEVMIDDDDDKVLSCESVPTGNALYSLNISAECSLTNGFRYVKELLMQHHNFYLNKCNKLLQAHGIEVYTVKTDSFTIQKTCLEQARELLNFDNGIGSWRVHNEEDIKFPKSMIEFTENKLIEVKEYKTEPIELTIEDEYNTDKLCEYFEQHRRVMIRADYPGSGKSYACRKMMDMGAQRVVCLPY